MHWRAGFDELLFLIRPDIEAGFRETILSRLPSSLHYTIAYQTLDDLVESASSPDVVVRWSASKQKRVKPWGTGHALLCVKDAFQSDEPFAVINADDFYGAQAFEAIAKQLAQNPAEFCLVGYRLEDVVPASGTVSRGICSVDPDGYLEQIIEHKVVWRENNHFYSQQGESKIELSPDMPVSMNMWGFNASIFEYLIQAWDTFICRYVDSPTQEFLLPDIVQDMLKKKSCVSECCLQAQRASD